MAEQAAEYRADIDGLRAIAVGTVVLFHYGLTLIPGGFVGVDIFFVISGYLITSLMWKDLTQSRFSILTFYARRFRRILPALLVVLGVSLTVGYFYLLPDDLGRLTDQSAFAALGAANFYFLFNSGYFDADSGLQPMLHMWSLGVEEQFYLIWPALLMLICKFSGSRAGVVAPVFLALVAIGSLGASIWLTNADPSFSFYMLPTRAWELALGALLVFAPVQRGWLVWTSPILGLVLIAASVVLVTEQMAFPGWIAVIPALGAALVIWPRASRGGGRFLESEAMIGLGKISYSLYLWHWPVIVFWRLMNVGKEMTFLEAAGLVGISVLLAILSYTLVEQPFRQFKFGKLKTVGSGIFGMAVAAGAAMVMPVQTAAIATNMGDVEKLYLDVASNRAYHGSDHKCFLGSGNKSADELNTDLCLPKPDGRRRVLLLGESFADQYDLALRDAFPDTQFLIATASGCHPTFPLEGRDVCMNLVSKALAEVAGQAKPDVILLASKWTARDAEKMAETVRTLKQTAATVAVIGQPVEYKEALPKLLLASATVKDNGAIVDAARDYGRIVNINTAMNIQSAAAGAQFFSVLDLLCPAGKCETLTRDGIPMQVDYGHFTRQGAGVIVQRLKQRGLLAN